MYASADKTLSHHSRQQEGGATFFRKAGEDTFGNAEPRTFFSAGIQARLSVSNPDDPQEREADAVAASVMSMSEVQSTTQPEEDQRVAKKQEEEEVSTRAEIPILRFSGKEEEEPEMDKVSRKAELHRKQAQQEEEEPATEALIQSSLGNNEFVHTYAIDAVHRSSRGPPADSSRFEESLQQSKGSGSVLPSHTLSFMENRFQADFSGVRVHTGDSAISMSRDIHAQAFTHGNDIYFNSGRYSPDTYEGGFLLAHELTHTLHQGASKPVSRKSSPLLIHRKQDLGIEDLRPPALIKDRGIHSFNTISNEALPPAPGEDRSEGMYQLKASGNPGGEQPGIADRPGSSSSPTSIHSNSFVDPSGILQQRGEAKDEAMEGEKEEELQAFSVNPLHEAKHIERLNAKGQFSLQPVTLAKLHRKRSSSVFEEKTSHAKQENVSHELNRMHNRGPPSVANIQRSWLGNAWAAVSGVASNVASIVESGLDAAKAWMLDRARSFVQNIPGYRLIGIILRQDPVTRQPIERSGYNILNAGLDLIPFGDLFRQVLLRLNAMNDAAAWIDGRMQDLELLVTGIGNRFHQFFESLSLSDIGNPEQVLRRVADLFSGIITNLASFLSRAANDFLQIAKRLTLRLIVDFVRGRIPNLYPLLCVALGHDPITGEVVVRNGTNILNAALEVSEEGREQRRQMMETGTFQRIAGWIDRGISVFTTAYQQLRAAFSNLWESVSIQSLASPVETFNRIYADFETPVVLVRNFIRDLALEIIRAIKDALLRRLSEYASEVRGYRLLTVLIGRDPFTGEVVPRTVENIIRGFMSLMEGGEEQYRQMEESGAISRAAQRIYAAIETLNMTVAYVIGLFTALWNSFSLQDLARPFEAFQRIVNRFGEPIGRLVLFVVEILRIVITVILEVMNFPFDLISNIINRAMAAIEHIRANPIGFLLNLLRAIKQGFIQFFDNILVHLLNGLTGWLMSELRDANVPAPQDFSLRGIIQWVLQVLGISMEAIWQKLAEHPRIGPERVARLRRMINTLEGIWTFIRDVQERGMAAIWDKIQEQLSNLWNTVLDAVKNWIMERIINQVVARLLSMLDPTGIMAVINSAIAIYRAVQSFIRYLREMLEVINSFVNGVAEIAEGKIETAANYLESTMGRAMPIVIGFLANQVGLSGIGHRIAQMIGSARELVDQALTWLVNRAVNTGMNLLDRVMAAGRSAVGAVMGWLGIRKEFNTNSGQHHTLYFSGSGASAGLIIESSPKPISVFLDESQTALNADTSLDAASKQDKQTKINEAQQKVTAIRALTNPADPSAPPPANQEQQVNTLINELSDLIKVIDSAGAAGPVVPQALYTPGFTTQRAEHAEAKFVYKDGTGRKNHADGQPANAYNGDLSGALDAINVAGLRSVWVAFHVINEHLGGRATDSNLIPTPRYINGEFNRAFEEPLKRHYNAANPVPVWMTAIVSYRNTGPNLVNNFQATGGGMKYENDSWVEDPARRVPDFSRSIDIPDPEKIFINQLPSNTEDWYLIVNMTPLQTPVLTIVKEKAAGLIASKQQLKALIATHAASYGYSGSYVSNMQSQVDNAAIDFTP